MKKFQRGGKVKWGNPKANPAPLKPRRPNEHVNPRNPVQPKTGIDPSTGYRYGYKPRYMTKGEQAGLAGGVVATAAMIEAARRANNRETNRSEDIRMSEGEIKRLRSGHKHKKHGGAVGPNGIL
jgi:hypothetical protein